MKVIPLTDEHAKGLALAADIIETATKALDGAKVNRAAIWNQILSLNKLDVGDTHPSLSDDGKYLIIQ